MTIDYAPIASVTPGRYETTMIADVDPTLPRFGTDLIAPHCNLGAALHCTLSHTPRHSTKARRVILRADERLDLPTFECNPFALPTQRPTVARARIVRY